MQHQTFALIASVAIVLSSLTATAQPTPPPPVAHPVVFWEISTPAYDQSLAFYNQLFGWENHAETSDGVTMTLLGSTGQMGEQVVGISGSIMQSSETLPPFQTIYIFTPALEATVEAVTANGGTIVVPIMEVEPGMSFAHFTDPEGHLVGLIAIGDEVEHPQLGSSESPVIHWEMGTRDVAGMTAFYSTVFGWTIEPSEHDYAMANTSIEGVVGVSGGFAPLEEGVDPYLCWYVGVGEVAVAFGSAVALGATPVLEPTQVMEGVNIAMVLDPGGNPLGLFQMPAAPPADPQ